MIELYRAVDADELESIRSSGRFLPSPAGTSYKGFFLSRQSADQFGAQQVAMGGPKTVTVVGVAPDALVAASAKHEAASEGAGVYIAIRDLKRVQLDG